MATFEAINDRTQDPDSAHSLLAMSKTPATPIAVIGMACRLPGGIDSPDLLWEALLRGDDLVTEIPPDRWDAARVLRPRARRARSVGVEVGCVPGRRRRLRSRVLRDQRARGHRDRSAAPVAAGDLLGGSGTRRPDPGVVGRLLDGCVRRVVPRRLPCWSPATRAPWRIRTGSPAVPSAWLPGGSRTQWGCTVPR